MKREVLVSRLIARAKARYGVRVSDEIFGEWLRKKLILAPPKKGQTREWNKRHYRIALEICRLNAEGVRFFGIIRWHLWLKGFSPPNFRPTTQRKHLLKEFRHLRKSLVQTIYTTHDPRNGETISDRRINRIAKSLGRQDDRLKPILPLTSAQIFNARNLIQFGIDEGNLASPLSSKVIEHLKHIAPASDLTLINEMAAKVTSIGTTGLLSLWGGPDEVEASGEQSIKVASNEAFEFARVSLAGATKGIRLLGKGDEANRDGYQAAAKSLTKADWRIGTFVTFLHLVVRLPIVQQDSFFDINLDKSTK